MSYLTLKAMKLPDSLTELASLNQINGLGRGSVSTGVNSLRTVPTEYQYVSEQYIPIAADSRGTIHPAAKASGFSLPLDPTIVTHETFRICF